MRTQYNENQAAREEIENASFNRFIQVVNMRHILLNASAMNINNNKSILFNTNTSGMPPFSNPIEKQIKWFFCSFFLRIFQNS